MTAAFVPMSFKARLRSMLKLDFYRLVHTPALYIMLLVSAIIPAMILSMSGADSGASTGNAPAAPAIELTNAWQLIESTGGSAVAANPLDFGGFANINMLYIFAGLFVSIFVAHDYGSGFVKNVFTVHARKVDYVISKTAAAVFGGAGMIIAYVAGTVVAGLITGKSFDVDVSGLVLCLLSKAFLMGVFCALFLAISVFFRSRLWLTIVFTFLLGMTLYPAASVATLGSTVATAAVSLIAGAVGAAGFGAVSSLILNRRDLA